MNVSEQTVKPKNTRVAYHYERYPMDLYDADGRAKKVKNEAEEENALALGFTENPPAIPQSVAVAAMTTQPAIQSGYDALKRELEGKTVEFNRKYSALQLEFQALREKHLELQGDYADLTAEHEALLNQKPQAQPEHPPAEEPASVDQLLNELNPFAGLQTAPAAVVAPQKSRAALMADELKAKAKAEKATKAAAADK